MGMCWDLYRASRTGWGSSPGGIVTLPREERELTIRGVQIFMRPLSATARTPVLHEANRVGALSALLRYRR